MTKETPIMREIMLAVSKVGVRIFRNNVAMAWVGRVITRSDGMVTIDNARPLHAGLCEGSADLIGWHSITITPDMVGKKVAVFVAIEAKSSKGTVKENQLNFLNAVQAAGGIAIVARSPQDALNIIENPIL